MSTRGASGLVLERHWRMMGASEGIPGLAFVELRRRLPPEWRQLEPVEDEQRALDPTDFAQGPRQAVLTRISSEALQEQRGARRPGAD